MRNSITFVVLTLLTFASCNTVEQPEPALRIAVTDQALTIHNQGAVPVYAVVFEQDLLTRTNWAAVCDSSLLIGPGRTSTIGLTDSSFLPSNTAVVFWWDGCDGGQGKNIRNSAVRVR